MDLLQVSISTFLIVAAIVAVYLFLRQWRHLIAVRIKGKVGVMTLRDALAFAFAIPVVLTGSVSVVWIYFKGWEDFTRILLVSIGFGFLMGFVTVGFFYLMNRLSLRYYKSE